MKQVPAKEQKAELIAILAVMLVDTPVSFLCIYLNATVGLTLLFVCGVGFGTFFATLPWAKRRYPQKHDLAAGFLHVARSGRLELPHYSRTARAVGKGRGRVQGAAIGVKRDVRARV